MTWTCNQTVNDGVAHSKNPRKCAYHVTFDLEHTLDAGLPGDHRVQVWSRSSHLPGRRSDFRASTKVPVFRDLWPWPWAHPGCTLTWSPSCESLVAIRPFVCEKKRFAQKFTDGRTDRQTDNGRLAIALAHSWNELKMKSNFIKSRYDVGKQFKDNTKFISFNRPIFGLTSG